MPVTLAGIALPDDLQWVDEFAGFGVGQNITPTLTGSLLVEEFGQTEGRPITLEAGGASWMERQAVQQLEALVATPLGDDQTLAFVWGDGRTFDVVFDRSRDNGFRAVELRRLAAEAQTDKHKYLITISLLIKEAP